MAKRKQTFERAARKRKAAQHARATARKQEQARAAESPVTPARKAGKAKRA